MPIQINELIIRANVAGQDETKLQDGGNPYSTPALVSPGSSMESMFNNKRRRER